MAEPSTHINYSFEDIQRYLQGKMSATEMHDIEKAALQDPFLADAIEGFNEADLTTAQQHLNEINTSLLKEKKESKVVAFNKRTQWMNVAALIIVLAGIGVVASYFLQSKNNQSPIAQVKKEPVQNNITKDSATGSVNTLANKPDTNTFIGENKLAKKKEPLTLKKSVIKKDDISNKDIEEDKANVASANLTLPPLFDSNFSSSLNDTIKYVFATNKALTQASASVNDALRGKVAGVSIFPTTFSGKVMDQNGEPVPFATIRVNNKQSVAADAAGYFSLKNNDTSLFVTTSAVGYTNNATIIKPVSENLIVLNKNSYAMSDVVVTTALGVSRKSKSLGYSTTSDSAQPVGGWDNFNHYVISQLNEDSTHENYMNDRDKVELEFLIDNAGNPYDIIITKPLDDERNSKAIDILKSGPKWTSPSKKKKAKVAIAIPPN